MSELPNHLQDLNPEQLEATRHGAGPLLIFAGAGSGKTRVLTRRVANLILEHGVHPSRILAVTFTNKAAWEMKRRVAASLGDTVRSTWVATFHATCARILRSHAEALDFKSNFAIYDASDSLSALKRVYKRLNVDPKLIDPRSVRSRIDRAKNSYRFPESVRNDRYLPRVMADTVADIYEAYQQELLSSNAMDFGDLICNVVTLFKLEPRILQHYQERFEYILVDEYQDTNRVQYLLVRQLTECHNNLCVVGDDDQSIYAFRGATVENILNFKKDYPEAKVVTLSTNYRSTRNIIDAANCVIARNAKRQKKSMRTENPRGRPIVCYYGYNEKEEAEFVVREMSTLFRNGIKPSDIAVFYRTNAQSRAVEEALCESSIPYEIFGGHRFYDRREIKDILAYYRLLVNPQDNDAFLRVINVPARGIGPTSIGALTAYANQKKLPLFDALKESLADSSASLSKPVKKKFEGFLSLIESLRLEAKACEELLSSNAEATPMSAKVHSISNLLKFIADESQYLAKLKAEDSPEAESRIENLYELFAVAADFTARELEQENNVVLGSFLERASLSSDADVENTQTNQKAEIGSDEEKQAVKLMTLHLAKGLEFSVVFLVGLEEGLLPHVRSMDDKSALEEERRLCYVGLTRAKSMLFLTRALNRQTYGQSTWFSGVASRFLDELPDEVLERRNQENFV